MDTTKIEYTAEDLISHKLQRNDILVAKPKFDREGTDLLAFTQINDGVKFCRIQCKGRSIINNSSSVKIPQSYVTSGFVLFLFVETSDSNQTNIYCFFESDFKGGLQWKLNSQKEYYLYISKSNFVYDFKNKVFNDSKAALIKSVINQAEIDGEFRMWSYGELNIEFPQLKVSMSGGSERQPEQNNLKTNSN